MKTLQKTIMMTALASVLVIPATGWAKNDKAKGKQDHNNFVEIDDDKVTIVIGDDDRSIIRNHLKDNAFRNCPPGLAKKNPPCIPPGQAKKYRIGYPLDVPFSPIPDSWGLNAPTGYQYVQVEKDVLLIAEASKKVIDAVTLLSAVD